VHVHFDKPNVSTRSTVSQTSTQVMVYIYMPLCVSLPSNGPKYSFSTRYGYLMSRNWFRHYLWW